MVRVGVAAEVTEAQAAALQQQQPPKATAPGGATGVASAASTKKKKKGTLASGLVGDDCTPPFGAQQQQALPPFATAAALGGVPTVIELWGNGAALSSLTDSSVRTFLLLRHLSLGADASASGSDSNNASADAISSLTSIGRIALEPAGAAVEAWAAACAPSLAFSLEAPAPPQPQQQQSQGPLAPASAFATASADTDPLQTFDGVGANNNGNNGAVAVGGSGTLVVPDGGGTHAAAVNVNGPTSNGVAASAAADLIARLCGRLTGANPSKLMPLKRVVLVSEEEALSDGGCGSEGATVEGRRKPQSIVLPLSTSSLRVTAKFYEVAEEEAAEVISPLSDPAIAPPATHAGRTRCEVLPPPQVITVATPAPQQAPKEKGGGGSVEEKGGDPTATLTAIPTGFWEGPSSLAFNKVGGATLSTTTASGSTNNNNTNSSGSGGYFGAAAEGRGADTDNNADADALLRRKLPIDFRCPSTAVRSFLRGASRGILLARCVEKYSSRGRWVRRILVVIDTSIGPPDDDDEAEEIEKRRRARGKPWGSAKSSKKGGGNEMFSQSASSQSSHRRRLANNKSNSLFVAGAAEERSAVLSPPPLRTAAAAVREARRAQREVIGAECERRRAAHRSAVRAAAAEGRRRQIAAALVLGGGDGDEAGAEGEGRAPPQSLPLPSSLHPPPANLYLAVVMATTAQHQPDILVGTATSSSSFVGSPSAVVASGVSTVFSPLAGNSAGGGDSSAFGHNNGIAATAISNNSSSDTMMMLFDADLVLFASLQRDRWASLRGMAAAASSSSSASAGNNNNQYDPSYHATNTTTSLAFNNNSSSGGGSAGGANNSTVAAAAAAAMWAEERILRRIPNLLHFENEMEGGDDDSPLAGGDAVLLRCPQQPQQQMRGCEPAPHDALSSVSASELCLRPPFLFAPVVTAHDAVAAVRRFAAKKRQHDERQEEQRRRRRYSEEDQQRIDSMRRQRRRDSEERESLSESSSSNEVVGFGGSGSESHSSFLSSSLSDASSSFFSSSSSYSRTSSASEGLFDSDEDESGGGKWSSSKRKRANMKRKKRTDRRAATVSGERSQLTSTTTDTTADAFDINLLILDDNGIIHREISGRSVLAFTEIAKTGTVIIAVESELVFIYREDARRGFLGERISAAAASQPAQLRHAMELERLACGGGSQQSQRFLPDAHANSASSPTASASSTSVQTAVSAAVVVPTPPPFFAQFTNVGGTLPSIRDIHTVLTSLRYPEIQFIVDASPFSSLLNPLRVTGKTRWAMRQLYLAAKAKEAEARAASAAELEARQRRSAAAASAAAVAAERRGRAAIDNAEDAAFGAIAEAFLSEMPRQPLAVAQMMMMMMGSRKGSGESDTPAGAVSGSSGSGDGDVSCENGNKPSSTPSPPSSSKPGVGGGSKDASDEKTSPTDVAAVKACDDGDQKREEEDEEIKEKEEERSPLSACLSGVQVATESGNSSQPNSKPPPPSEIGAAAAMSSSGPATAAGSPHLRPEWADGGALSPILPLPSSAGAAPPSSACGGVQHSADATHEGRALNTEHQRTTPLLGSTANSNTDNGKVLHNHNDVSEEAVSSTAEENAIATSRTLFDEGTTAVAPPRPTPSSLSSAPRTLAAAIAALVARGQNQNKGGETSEQKTLQETDTNNISIRGETKDSLQPLPRAARRDPPSGESLLLAALPPPPSPDEAPQPHRLRSLIDHSHNIVLRSSPPSYEEVTPILRTPPRHEERDGEEEEVIGGNEGATQIKREEEDQTSFGRRPRQRGLFLLLMSPLLADTDQEATTSDARSSQIAVDGYNSSATGVHSSDAVGTLHNDPPPEGEEEGTTSLVRRNPPRPPPLQSEEQSESVFLMCTRLGTVTANNNAEEKREEKVRTSACGSDATSPSPLLGEMSVAAVGMRADSLSLSPLLPPHLLSFSSYSSPSSPPPHHAQRRLHYSRGGGTAATSLLLSPRLEDSGTEDSDSSSNSNIGGEAPAVRGCALAADSSLSLSPPQARGFRAITSTTEQRQVEAATPRASTEECEQEVNGNRAGGASSAVPVLSEGTCSCSSSSNSNIVVENPPRVQRDQGLGGGSGSGQILLFDDI